MLLLLLPNLEKSEILMLFINHDEQLMVAHNIVRAKVEIPLIRAEYFSLASSL